MVRLVARAAALRRRIHDVFGSERGKRGARARRMALTRAGRWAVTVVDSAGLAEERRFLSLHLHNSLPRCEVASEAHQKNVRSVGARLVEAKMFATLIE